MSRNNWINTFLSKSFPYLILFAWCTLGFYLVINGLIRFEIEKVEWGTELIPNKPEYKYILDNKSIVNNISNDSCGFLNKNVLIYSDKIPKDSIDIIEGKIFGWVYASSVLEQDGTLTLIVDENIRNKADGIIIGRLNKGTIIKMHYINKLKSWYLFDATIKISSKDIKLQYEKQTFRERLRNLPKIISLTTKDGGKTVVRGWLDIGHIVIVGPLIWILVSLTWILLKSKNKQKKDTRTIILEIVKASLQIIVGITIAAAIYYLGIK